MAVGDTHREPTHEFADPVSGRRVRRLTDLATHCHHPYFYCRSFTPDSRRVAYVSHRTGRACAYLLDLTDGRSVQLTDCAGLSEFLLQVTSDGRYLLYSEGQHLHRLQLESLRDEVIWTQRAPWTAGEGVYPGYGDGEQTALMAQMHAEDMVPRKSGWDFFEPQCLARPRCRLVLVDLSTGAERVVREEACWLGHPQIRPGDAQTLMYCHEGPAHCIDARIWLIRPDGTHNRPMGYLLAQPTRDREIITHEYFTPDGRHIAYTHFPRHYGRDGTIRLMDVEAMRETNLGPVHNYSHFYHSPDCRRIVGDETTPDQKPRNCIWVFDVARRKEHPLCLHGSSFAPRGSSTQDAHPHPSFSPDGRSVLFSSDRETSPTGNCAVYLADASWEG